MANLSCGIIRLEVSYKDIEQFSGDFYYTYAIRLFLYNRPLFSETIENDLLADNGHIIATSDGVDNLLNVFQSIIDKSTPVGTTESFYSEVDSPQQIFLHVSKEYFPNCGNMVFYPLKIELSGDTFLGSHGLGNLILTSHWFDDKIIRNFVSELKQEKEQLLKQN